MKVELSNSLKSRFCKDYKLPFQVVQEPMFSYYIETLDAEFDTKQKLQLLEQAVILLGGEDAFFAESSRVKDTIVSKVQSTNVYQSLSTNRLDEYTVNTGVPQNDIYNMSNVNKTFISLDLTKANFNVFKMFDSELVLGFDSYDELIGSVTEFDYFKKSKYLRQVIFGNMLPKKQQKLQKWVMSKIINVLNTDVGIQMEDFVSASADEVVFAVAPEGVEQFTEMVARKIIENSETEKFASWVRVESFTLKSIGDKKFFAKENIDGSVEFKGIPAYFFMQVYKKYMDLPIEDMDKTFYHDGMLATFNKTVFED